MKRLTLVIALIGAAGAAEAQSTQPYMPGHVPSNPPVGPVVREPVSGGARVDGTGARIDANGNRIIGSDLWVRDRGDPMPSGGVSAGVEAPMSYPRTPSVAGQPPMIGERIPANRDAAFRDEYGFRYDGQGNRIDARGNIISPQTR